jgi:phospholipid transport system substrate-binding protein
MLTNVTMWNRCFAAVSMVVALASSDALGQTPTSGTTSAAPAKASSDALDAVKKANTDLYVLLKKTAPAGSEQEKKTTASINAVVRQLIDIDELGKRALVDHWQTLSTAQKTEFQSLLRSLLEENYVRGVRANVDYEVEYGGAQPSAAAADITIVATTIKAKRKGRPYSIKVDYSVIGSGKNLRVIDVATDGVGLITNYRAQFGKIIKKDGIDGLIAKMKKKQSK